MTSFWIVAAAMVAVALAFLAPTLLGRKRLSSQDRSDQNVQIARERLNELESEFGRGALSEADYERARQELELALLNDVGDELPTTEKDQLTASPITLAILIVLVPLFTILLYLDIGKPEILQTAAKSAPTAPSPHGSTADQAAPSIDELLGRLEEKLKANPNDAQGWYMLGRSYMSLGRYAEAVTALGRAYELAGDQPTVMLSYADALAMSQGGKISGKAFELIKKALALSPKDPTALWLAGLGYQEQGDYERAVGYWRQLEPMMADNPESLSEVRRLIANAEQQLGYSVKSEPVEITPAPTSSVAITVQVDISPTLRDKASPNDTVFIFARAASGPPMPLAVVRKLVSDLPIAVTLDDSMAMMPQMKLSSFTDVNIGARISKTGNAMPQSGDLKSADTPINTAKDKTVTLSIDSIVP
jgi:cytochrome c-type biogenesis protein CcmH